MADQPNDTGAAMRRALLGKVPPLEYHGTSVLEALKLSLLTSTAATLVVVLLGVAAVDSAISTTAQFKCLDKAEFLAPRRDEYMYGPATN